MAESAYRVFQQLLKHPIEVYEEGRRFFHGTGMLYASIQRLAADLDGWQIPYVMIGAVGLNLYGYHRFTTNVNLVMTSAGLSRFGELLVGRGYRPAFQEATRKFRTTDANVQIEVCVTGEYPGDGRPNPVAFPDPEERSVQINGVTTVSLTKLIDLKLASGISGPGRLKDLGDVQELIRFLGLSASLAAELDPYVRAKYLELHADLELAKIQTLAPDSERPSEP